MTRNLLFLILGCHLLYACGSTHTSTATDAGSNEGPLSLELGYYDVGETHGYRALADGGDCSVVYGLQGGTWTMPALRFSGIDSPAQVSASLITASGELVGMSDAGQSFVVDQQGFAEIGRFPIPVRHAAPNEDAAIDDLYGQTATLSIALSDERNRSVSQATRVVLRAGTL